MTLKLYLAAHFAEQAEMRLLRSRLHQLGHEVTSSWLDQTAPQARARRLVAQPDRYREIARTDVADIHRSDTLVLVRGDPGRGKHVEFGIALAWGLRLILIGEPEVVFHVLPVVECYPDVEAFLAAMGEEAE